MTDLRKLIQDEIKIPAVLENVIETANADLYHGPVYFDNDGDRCECFDGAIRSFDFQRATEIIGNWLDELPTFYFVEFWPGLDTSDNDGEYPEINFQEIKSALVGRELSQYV